MIRPIAWLAALTLLAGRAAAAQEPDRVVSINLCTDQLAILLAKPGQLYSVSNLAADPHSSMLSKEAAAFRLNHGLAEEILLMKPTLVLAGTYTKLTTVMLLKRLGVRVEQFAPETTFSGIRENIRRMGRLLGQDEKAEQLVAEFDARLATARKDRPDGRVAAIYFFNGYSPGTKSLANEALSAAGFDNLTRILKKESGGTVLLEVLVSRKPDAIVTGDRWADAPSKGQDLFRHPALIGLKGAAAIAIPDRYWLCGGPFTADLVERLAEAPFSPRP